MAASKLGVIHYNWPGYDLEGFVKRVAEIGFQYVELMISDLWDGTTDAQSDGRRGADAVRELLERFNIQASAISVNNNFLMLDSDEQESQIQRYRDICMLAAHMGVPVLRTDGGSADPDQLSRDRWDGMMLDAFKRCVDFAEQHDVTIALDNHGVATNDGDWQLSLFERVASDRLGTNLDTMNYRWFGHDIDTCNHYYKLLAPYVVHTHMKDGCGSREHYQGAALGDGEIGLEHAVQCVKSAGYDGVWCAEYEGPEPENGVGYAKCYQWMQTHI